MKKLFSVLILLAIPLILFAQGDGDSGSPIWGYVAVLLGAIGSLFTGFRLWWRKKSKKLLEVGREVFEFASEVNDVIKAHDHVANKDNPTAEELKAVWDEIKDLKPASKEFWEAAKSLFNKG